MSQTATSGLVRVTVASRTRRVDLALPAVVPVAELVPELARSVGLLDGSSAHGGYHLVTCTGRTLAGDAGLAMQGVADGALLMVVPGVEDRPYRAYDDVVEAMTDVVERDLVPWQAVHDLPTAQIAAALFLGLGAVALLLAQQSLLAAATAVLAALGLVVGAIGVARYRDESAVGVVVAWIGSAYAAVGGVLLAPDSASSAAMPLAFAGVGAAVAGLACMVGLDADRMLLIPPVVTGAILVATGLLMRAVAYDASAVLTTTLVLAVMCGSLFPGLALGFTGTRPDRLVAAGRGEFDPIDLDRVRADAWIAHEILVAISVTVGLMLILVAPLAVSTGLPGTVLAAMCCCVVMLRTRRYRSGTEVFVGLVSGIGGLASVATSVLWLHPGWRSAASVALTVVGGLLLTLTLLPRTRPARRARFGDVAETASLLSLPTLLVLAVGFASVVRP